MTTLTVPSRAYPAGVTNYGPFTVNAGTTIKIGLLREAWPDSNGEEIISLDAEVSFDGGNTWDFLFQFGTAGGTLPLDRNGNPQNTSSVMSGLTTPCRLRGTVTLQQPLTTTVTITIL